MSRKPSCKLTEDPVLNRVLDLLREKGRTEKEMAQYLEISITSFTGWKYRESKTFMKHVGSMAEYLDVSVNYLLYGKDEEINEETLSASEINLVRRFRRMNPEQRACIVQTSKCFVGD